MKLAFNATPLLSPLTGIGQYTHHLASWLAARPDLDTEFFYATGWSHKVRDEPLSHIRTWKSIARRFIPNTYATARWLQQRNFNKRARGARFDLYHEPNFLAFDFPGPSVITVHDLSWIRYPETHPEVRVRAMGRYFEPALRRARLLLTVSEFVKQEVRQVFGVPAERIRAIPNGVEPWFVPRNEGETRATLQPHGLRHGHYLLLLGTIEPRKNIGVALDAYERLPAAVRRHHPLVMVGMKGWHTTRLQARLAPLVESGEVRALGYLPRADLATVIAGATALVYPSLYEGFGLPPLEAMACGVVPIVSNVSSLPEVVADTGLMVAPHDVDALTEAMRHMIDAPDVRAQLGLRARERARQYSWDRCAEQTLQAYRDVLAA